jgi:hypothetical protein
MRLLIKYHLTLLFIFCLSSIFSQTNRKESEEIKTKIDEFTSRTGVILKFTDFNLGILKDKYNSLSETRIRKIESGTIISYFYQITLKGKYSNSTASIEYNDLLELIKALEFMKNSELKDIESNPEYLENKFMTEDGFQVGYYVRNGKSFWYLQLEKYGSDKTLFIENAEIIYTAFNEAKNKIESFKK